MIRITLIKIIKPLWIHIVFTAVLQYLQRYLVSEKMVLVRDKLLCYYTFIKLNRHNFLY